jgi:hypothetical protein
MSRLMVRVDTSSRRASHDPVRPDEPAARSSSAIAYSRSVRFTAPRMPEKR